MFPFAINGKTMYGEKSGESKHTPRRPRMWAWMKSFMMRLSAKKPLTSSSDTRSVYVNVRMCVYVVCVYVYVLILCVVCVAVMTSAW